MADKRFSLLFLRFFVFVIYLSFWLNAMLLYQAYEYVHENKKYLATIVFFVSGKWKGCKKDTGKYFENLAKVSSLKGIFCVWGILKLFTVENLIQCFNILVSEVVQKHGNANLISCFNLYKSFSFGPPF